MSREFTMPKKIITGENALENSVEIFKNSGKKAFIVTGKHVVKLHFFKILINTLEQAGVTYTIFDGITGEPTDTMIDEGVTVYKESGGDFLIGIGG
ncbi:MAG: iron-containing alcohol dehydrogenase, partial [Clostridia bacterium]